MDISGWFLSDDATNPAKYRIPAGTVLPAGGYVTFFEDLHFGAASIDPNKVTPFALSDLGETVHLSSAVNDELTDYQTREDFGASAEGETLGNYYKPSSNTFNFIAMASPTPGTANGAPRPAPIVISEIMYNPPGSADGEEFIELFNPGPGPVTLYDAVKQKPWRFTDGIDFEFPTNPPLTMAAGERVILARNLAGFDAAFQTSPTLRKFQWTGGILDNGGETLQLAKPGGADAFNVTQYIRIDRVNYSDDAPWVTTPDGSGPALAKISETDYGNDFLNWWAATASPGTASPGERFEAWATAHGVAEPEADPDDDGLSNLLEYGLGTDPSASNAAIPVTLAFDHQGAFVSYDLRLPAADAVYQLEASSDLLTWTRVDASPIGVYGGIQSRQYREPEGMARRFYRLSIALKP